MHPAHWYVHTCALGQRPGRCRAVGTDEDEPPRGRAQRRSPRTNRSIWNPDTGVPSGTPGGTGVSSGPRGGSSPVPLALPEGGGGPHGPSVTLRGHLCKQGFRGFKGEKGEPGQPGLDGLDAPCQLVQYFLSSFLASFSRARVLQPSA